MTVKDFIEGYKKSDDKEKYMRDHIVNNYVSYAVKIDECRQIVELSNYKEINKKMVLFKNSPMRYLFFIIKLLTYYTDISIKNNIIDSFDALNELGLIDIIVASIPETEFNEWNTVLSMCDDDFEINIRSITSYIDTKLESIDILSNKLMENISE